VQSFLKDFSSDMKKVIQAKIKDPSAEQKQKDEIEKK